MTECFLTLVQYAFYYTTIFHENNNHSEGILTEEISTPGIAQNYPELQKRCARLDEVHKALDEAYAEYEKYI